MHDDISIDDPIHAHLHCMECGYDLTGIPEDRCPECGLPEARKRVVAWLTHANQSLPFGNLPAGETPGSIWFVSLFQPARLGKLLPPFASEAQVKGHLWGMRGLTFAIICFSTFLQIRRMSEWLLLSALFSGSVFIGTAVCERLSAAFMKACAKEVNAPGPQLWLNLVRCHATFLPISCIFTQIGIFSPMRILSWTYTRNSSVETLFLCLLPPLIWWNLNLVLAFRARTRPGFRPMLVGLCLFLSAGISITIGVFAAVITGLACPMV